MMKRVLRAVPRDELFTPLQIATKGEILRIDVGDTEVVKTFDETMKAICLYNVIGGTRVYVGWIDMGGDKVPEILTSSTGYILDPGQSFQIDFAIKGLRLICATGVTTHISVIIIV